MWVDHTIDQPQSYLQTSNGIEFDMVDVAVQKEARVSADVSKLNSSRGRNFRYVPKLGIPTRREIHLRSSFLLELFACFSRSINSI